jgi:sugar phosphate isomerase/epimerase
MAKRTDRRQFLQDAAIGVTTAGAAALLGTRVLAETPHVAIGLQLYTVRDDLKKDLNGTLRAVAAIGYHNVETAPGDDSAKTVHDALVAAGLTTPSGHCQTHHIAEQPDAVIENAKILGQQYLVCAWLQALDASLHSDRSREGNKLTLDDFRRHAELFNRFGEKCRKAGIQFGYHAHNFEFKTHDGIEPFDLLLQQTDPKYVQVEMDCYWMTRAGKDPVSFFEKYPGRISLLHIKDMKPVSGPSVDVQAGGDAFTEVGTGTIDWKRIFAAAEKAGVKYAFVEQDKCERPAIESAKISYDNLRKLLA